MHAGFSPLMWAIVYMRISHPTFREDCIFQRNIVNAIGPRRLVHEHMVLSHQCLRKICSCMLLPTRIQFKRLNLRAVHRQFRTHARALFLRSAFCRVYAYTYTTAALERGTAHKTIIGAQPTSTE
jgi:hypothetical protein